MATKTKFREWCWRKFIKIYQHFKTDDEVKFLKLQHLIRLNYEEEFKEPLHLLFPKTLNEKLIWLSLYWQHPLKSFCADKYKMRQYVIEQCHLPETLLVPLYGIYHSAQEIDFNVLPQSFVLKCNHGCGYNILVRNKMCIDTKIVKDQLNHWLLNTYRGG